MTRDLAAMRAACEAGYVSTADYVKEKGMSDYLVQYLQYLVNTGSADTGLPIAHFDDDWEPIGPVVRRDLLNRRYAAEADGKIFMTLLGHETIGDYTP